MEVQKCSPFGRRERRSKSKFDASQFNDQPANFWIQAIAAKLPKTKEVPPKLSSGIQADSGGAESEEELPPGTGTVLAVLDSGIQRDQRAFSNSEVSFDDKVLLCKNFMDPDDEDCEDVFGHGTECAGLACGLSFKGVDEDGEPLPKEFNSPAPGAKLMVCKIGNGDGSEEDLLEAIIASLKFIIEFNSEDENEDKKVDVVSISLGFDSFNKDLALAIQEAVAKDIIVVCCASNDGANFSNPITYPGRLGHVLCIGACDNNGQPAKFSSEGREVDFVELGTDVWAPTISHRDNEMVVLNGTSYSTPSVAGLICVLLQDLKRLSTDRNQFLWEDMHNVWCMRELLKSMCVMQGHHDNAKGYGKLNPKEYFKKGDEERIRICNEILGK